MEDLTSPQEFVIFKRISYSPGVVKLNSGFCDADVVLFKYVGSEAKTSQSKLVWVTVHK